MLLFNNVSTAGGTISLLQEERQEHKLKQGKVSPRCSRPSRLLLEEQHCIFSGVLHRVSSPVRSPPALLGSTHHVRAGRPEGLQLAERLAMGLEQAELLCG